MRNRARTALHKIAKNPGFLDSLQAWGGSLFDGKQGTSLKPFNNMMNSEGMNNFNNSWNAFTQVGGDWVNTLSDGKGGTSWDAFKKMYTGDSAPWALGATAAAAISMANAFNSNANNTNNGNNRSGSGFSGLVPWLALGGLAYGTYKLMPQIKTWVGAYSDVNRLNSGTAEDKATTLQTLSTDQGRRTAAEKMVEAGGTPKQLRQFRQNTKVAPIAQRNNTELSAAHHKWYLPDQTVHNAYLNKTNAPEVLNASNNAYNRLDNLGYTDGTVNTAASLTDETLAGWDSKNLDNRGLEELALLGTLKLSPEAYNKQYRAIVNRYNERKGGSTTNPITGNNISLTSRKQVQQTPPGSGVRFNPADRSTFTYNYDPKRTGLI